MSNQYVMLHKTPFRMWFHKWENYSKKLPLPSSVLSFQNSFDLLHCYDPKISNTMFSSGKIRLDANRFFIFHQHLDNDSPCGLCAACSCGLHATTVSPCSICVLPHSPHSVQWRCVCVSALESPVVTGVVRVQTAHFLYYCLVCCSYLSYGIIMRNFLFSCYTVSTAETVSYLKTCQPVWIQSAKASLLTGRNAWWNKARHRKKLSPTEVKLKSSWCNWSMKSHTKWVQTVPAHLLPATETVKEVKVQTLSLNLSWTAHIKHW